MQWSNCTCTAQAAEKKPLPAVRAGMQAQAAAEVPLASKATVLCSSDKSKAPAKVSVSAKGTSAGVTHRATSVLQCMLSGGWHFPQAVNVRKQQLLYGIAQVYVQRSLTQMRMCPLSF